MGRHTQQEVTATGLRNEKWHTTHPRHFHFTTLTIRRADQPHFVKRNGTKWGFGPLYCSRVFLLGFGRFSSNKLNRTHECTSKCHSINLEWKKNFFFFFLLPPWHSLIGFQWTLGQSIYYERAVQSRQKQNTSTCEMSVRSAYNYVL